MTSLYFFRWPLIIFLTGLVIRFAGTLFKIRHWPYADEIITIGTVIGVAGLLFAITKLLFLKKE